MVFNNGLVIQWGASIAGRTITLPIAKRVCQVIGSTQDTGDGYVTVFAASNYGIGQFYCICGTGGSQFNEYAHYVVICI